MQTIIKYIKCLRNSICHFPGQRQRFTKIVLVSLWLSVSLGISACTYAPHLTSRYECPSRTVKQTFYPHASVAAFLKPACRTFLSRGQMDFTVVVPVTFKYFLILYRPLEESLTRFACLYAVVKAWNEKKVVRDYWGGYGSRSGGGADMSQIRAGSPKTTSTTL